jgi:hypothetical protein
MMNQDNNAYGPKRRKTKSIDSFAKKNLWVQYSKLIKIRLSKTLLLIVGQGK